MSHPFMVQGAELPSRYCVRVLIKPQKDTAETRGALEKYFMAYGVPRIDDRTWGYLDEEEVEYGDDRHHLLASASTDLTDSKWARTCADAVLVTDGTTDVEDILAYDRYWDEVFGIAE